jgi:hypothetical protein
MAFSSENADYRTLWRPDPIRGRRRLLEIRAAVFAKKPCSFDESTRNPGADSIKLTYGRDKP